MASSPGWKRLLHYNTGWFGHERSLADSSRFFFSKDGKHDPRAELEATLKAFETDPSRACDFPARFNFLKEAGLIQSTRPRCKEFEDWRNQLNVTSATLVYSSAFSHAPASIFGHTFLKLNSKGLDILDYGVNYAAATEDENAISYAFKGLFGGYSGRFALAPYYAKLNEYTYGESRDLWEYKIPFTPKEIERLVSHLWELIHQAEFDYFYFDENCSFQILTLLEVAKPELHLSHYNLYVLPIATLKQVLKQARGVEIKYRPSLQRQVKARFEVLSAEDQKRFKELISGRIPLASDASLALSDALNQYLFYKKQRDQGILSASHQALLRESLLRRAAQKTTSAPIALVEPKLRPEMGHGPYSFQFGGGINSRQSFETFRFRLGVHELLNPDTGYTPFSQIEGFAPEVRVWNGDQRVTLNRLDLFNAHSLFPIDFMEALPSWSVDLKWWYPRDLDCGPGCHVFNIDLGLGAATYSFNSQSQMFVLIHAVGEAGSAVHGARAGPAAEIGLLWKMSEKFKSLTTFRAQSQNFGAPHFYEANLGVSYAPSSEWEIRGQPVWDIFKDGRTRYENILSAILFF